MLVISIILHEYTCIYVACVECAVHTYVTSEVSCEIRECEIWMWMKLKLYEKYYQVYTCAYPCMYDIYSYPYGT